MSKPDSTTSSKTTKRLCSLAYHVVEMPLNANGDGPATVGVDAAKMTYEIWDATTLNPVKSFGLLAEANALCLLLNLDTIREALEA